MIAVIDRIVDNIAICEQIETERILHINMRDLPEGLKEGDVVREQNGVYVKDMTLTDERKEMIANKLKELFGYKE